MRLFFILITAALLFGCSSTERIYVGTSSMEDGIYLVEFDSNTGALTKKYHQNDVKRAGFMNLSPDKKYLYTVAAENKLRAYKIESDYTLTFLNEKTSSGVNPCHISTSINGRAVVAANYTSGDTTSVMIADDGSFEGKPMHYEHDHLPSPGTSKRQQAPHAHNTYQSPDGRYCFVADLGLDKIVTYKWDDNFEKMKLNDPPYAVVATGAGPRHFTFHPNQKFAYVINELNSTLSVFHYIGGGKLNLKQTVNTKPVNWSEANNCADIHVHPNGKFLYGSNRGSNTIVIFSINPEDGKLTLVGHESTRGNWPRNFTLSPDGEHLIVANERSGDIFVFKIDEDTGKLIYTNNMLKLPRPICLKFYSGDQSK